MGIRITFRGRIVKVTDEATEPLVGMEKGVTIKINSCKGVVDFMMHPIGEFKMIFNINVLR